MDRSKTILAAIDFSTCSGSALRQAARIGAWNNASLTVLHVVPIVVYAVSPEPFFPLELPATAALLEEALEHWKKWPPAREAGASATFERIVGLPRFEILERVRRDKPDLLVIGAHSELDARRGVGSTAAAVVQRAPVKVLLVREKQEGPFRSVVACVDFTETSRLALDQAIRVAAEDDSDLHVLHVYDDPSSGARPTAAFKANMPDLAQRYRQAVEQRLRSFCEPLAHETGALKAAFHAIQFDGHGKGIVDFIQREGCDLAVLGTRAKWNLHDFLLGSTAERVLREAPCCVLTVKPPGFQ